MIGKKMESHALCCDCDSCAHGETPLVSKPPVRPLRSLLTLRHRGGALKRVEFVGFASGRVAHIFWALNGHHELDLETGVLRGRPDWELDVLTLVELRAEYRRAKTDAPWAWSVSDRDGAS